MSELTKILKNYGIAGIHPAAGRYRVPAFAPKLEWVIDPIGQARGAGVPVYLKPNLLGEPNGSKPGMVLPQEMPQRRK